MSAVDNNLETLVSALQNPALYDHPVSGFQVVQTHISYVILTGDYVYKIKKPLDLGFLDFSTLERRHRFCEEEVRLNSRLAPELYLGVVPITGSPAAPVLGGEGEAFEYAVKMAQFPQEALMDRVLARGELKPAHIDQLADQVADFHGRIAVAGDDIPYGTPERVHFPVAQNFEQIRPLLEDSKDLAQLDRLETWSEQQYAAIGEALAARKQNGYVRECHGDMHLGNMALLDDQILIFDCIEFNENLYWIDVISEVAFLMMDLEDRGRADLARRYLNAYMQHTGDYGALALLPYYQAYRAMVRAKVSSIRLGQSGVSDEEKEQIYTQYRSYANLAETYTHATRPRLIITHGLSGSGKTTVTQPLVEALGAVRIRSDVERKRLFGLAADARSDSNVEGGLYTADASRRTYDRLAELAKTVVDAGRSVIVDATFLKQAQRDTFRSLAAELAVPFTLLDVQAGDDTLRARIAVREQAGQDASEANLAVLEHQLKTREPLGEDETATTISVSTETALNVDDLLSRLPS